MARNDTLRTRAASGIMLTGTTTGPGGAFPGLGQAGAGNARVRTQGLRSPVGATVQDRTSCRVPGSLAWSCAQGPKALTVRAVSGTPIGERVPARGARRTVRRGGWLNTSVGVPLPFFFRLSSSSLPDLIRQSMRTGSFIGFVGRLPEAHFSMDHRVKPGGDEEVVSKTRARMRRGKESVFTLPWRGRVGALHRQRDGVGCAATQGSGARCTRSTLPPRLRAATFPSRGR